MITNLHTGVYGATSKQILKSVIGSLNATIIAYSRGYLRMNDKPARSLKGAEALMALDNIALVRNGRTAADVPTLEDFNDGMAAITEEKGGAEVSNDFGMPVQMAPNELIERLMMVRNWMAAQLEDALGVLKTDKALSIAETIQFQLDNPQSIDVNVLEALAIAVDMDTAELVAAKVQTIEDDRAQLTALKDRIIDFTGQFTGSEWHADEMENVFGGLPAHVQYKLVGAGVRAHDKASKRAMENLLRGNIDAATDIKLLRASKADIQLWAKTFATVHRVALNEYLERGGQLPDMQPVAIVPRNASTPQAAALINKQNANEAARARVFEDQQAQLAMAETQRQQRANEVAVESIIKSTAPGPKAKRVAKTA